MGAAEGVAIMEVPRVRSQGVAGRTQVWDKKARRLRGGGQKKVATDNYADGVAKQRNDHMGGRGEGEERGKRAWAGKEGKAFDERP